MTLITGDVVTVASTPNGRPQASVAPVTRHGPAGQFLAFSAERDLYVVPETAAPRLGHGLSLSLFDVTKLATYPAKPTTVRLTYRSGKAGADVPGITITNRSGHTATGTVSAPRTFGKALAQHATRMFTKVASIAPTDQAAPPVHPDFPMHTLSIHAVGADGKAASGLSVLVWNVDDLRKYSGQPTVFDGLAKVSVPNGHYAAVAFFYNSTTGVVRMAAVPQFRVHGDSSVTLDARKATAKVSIDTPHPANPTSTEVTFARTDKHGATASYAFIGSGVTYYVQPSKRAPSAGKLHYYVYTHRTSPSSATKPYTYDLKFPSVGAVPANEHYVVSPSGLATVDATYSSETPHRTGLETRFGAMPWQNFLFSLDNNITQPISRTEYYTARPDLAWEALLYSYYDTTNFTLLGMYESAWRSYRPGEHLSASWVGQPEHPRPLQHNLFNGTTVCPACQNGSELSLLVFPFGDNDPKHRGYADGPAPGLTESIHYGVYADDVPVKTGDTMLDTRVTMPDGTKRYRIDYDVSRTLPGVFPLATQTHTRWTVRAKAPLGALPTGWSCSRVLSEHDCGVLPLMTDSYQLPVDDLGRVPSGKASGTMHVSHLRGSTALAVTRLRVRVSFDGGDHWRRVTVTDQGNGHYGLAFRVPKKSRTDGYGAIKVTARDAAGGTFSQTIQHAFAVQAA